MNNMHNDVFNMGNVYEQEQEEQVVEEPVQEMISLDDYFNQVAAGEITGTVGQNVKVNKKYKAKKNQPEEKKEKKEKKIKIVHEELVDITKIKNKKGNEDKLFGEKEGKNIIIIGHVDSGKSTICGNMLVKSGKVDDAELRRYE